MTSIMNKCLSIRCTQQTSVLEQSKEGATYSSHVQDPTRYILADFYHLQSVYCPGSL